MQVARNFFLGNEKTFSRKIYEVLLSWEIEAQLTKDKILEIYMNQIFLGQRAYGFSSAAQIYFGKELKDVTIAESAMLAGLPKAPTDFSWGWNLGGKAGKLSTIADPLLGLDQSLNGTTV